VERTVAIVDALKDRGFLTSNAGIFRNVLKFRPPLVFRQEHADAFLEAFDEVLAAEA
jgi:4-aminobutyrate aminotransferase-like enzyme